MPHAIAVSNYPTPLALHEAGFADLVSVIPPTAQLAPSSKIPAAHVGKVPGRRLANGLWAGYDWRRHEPTIDDVRSWYMSRANVGLRADRFPAVDIDCEDEALSRMIEEAAIASLGPAPVRVGKAPKRLLTYRTSEPFGRMRLWVKQGDDMHLVEILGQGQQYLVYGTHPSTMRAYEWLSDPVALGAAGLTPITREKAAAFLDTLERMLERLPGVKCDREGTGRPITRTPTPDQAELEAPSIDALRAAVAMIPNDNESFPDRSSYLKMGYAIRAAAGARIEDGFAIFSEWADRWEGNGRFAGNDPDVVCADWSRMRAPYSVGWSWIAEQARAYGYNDAGDEFDALALPPSHDERPTAAPRYSDQWLADRIVEARRHELRYSPESGRAYVWSGGRWQPDAELLAEDVIKRELRNIADNAAREGVTDKEKKEALARAMVICSATKAAQIWKLVQSERAIAISMSALDRDPWALNTPNGIIDLRTGTLGPAEPDALCTKATSVAPEFNGPCPEWRRFLAEATGGDRELEAYLQRLAGYSLTGATHEQVLVFVHGPGGNGKSVFLNVLSGILGGYARTAPMEAFTATRNERHPTDLAMLAGARLVTANETQAGKRWDEAKIKSLTGGDPITARHMRQDNFTYQPQFKLVFVGNHKPDIQHVDAAMRRRIQLVPFTVTPERVDTRLADKLQEEWPAILAWAVEGCQAWQKEGLNPPLSVRAATAGYLNDVDAIGQWLHEECIREPGCFTETQALFAAWSEYTAARRESGGTLRDFVQALENRGLARKHHPQTRRSGFRDIALRDPAGLLAAVA